MSLMRSTVTDVYWLEQTDTDLPAANDWLSPVEISRLNGLRFAKRRADWRLGRWTAKRAFAWSLKRSGDHGTLAQIEVRAAQSGAPQIFFQDQPSNITISLSHSSGMAICAVAPVEVALGCDLEQTQSRSNAFVEDYFTAEEQELIWRSPAAERHLLVSLFWSAKESALKALQAGLRLDTRSVVVSLGDISSDSSDWQPLRVTSDDQTFHGWWQQVDEFVQTIVSNPAPNVPICLSSCPQLPPFPSENNARFPL
jgi:4'-phosphopantetheinyl transferase